MSTLTFTQSPPAPADGAASSHLAAIKRFAKFALAFAAIVLLVTAVAAAKLAIFYPRFFH